MNQNTTTKLNWGIIGAGAIAKAFARGVAMGSTGTLLAVASRDQSKADAFGNEFNVSRRYGGDQGAGYDAILADKDVHAVYIATPHPMHAEWAIKAARAKKHLLVEKPMALNAAQVMAIIDAAEQNDVLLMEAFMYRCHPQTRKLVELIREKVIGDVCVINATFSFHSGFNADSRIFSNALAGGGTLDVGCYTASISRLIAGAAIGQDFADPIEVKGVAHLAKTGVDEWAVAVAKFPNDIVAQLATGVGVNQENVVRVFGTEGRIVVPNPYQANRTNAEPGKIIVHKKGEKEPQEITVPADVTSFAYEVDVFGRAALEGKKQAPSPAMTWDDSLGNIRTLDRWRETAGFTLEQEKPEGYPKVTIANVPLSMRADNSMAYGKIDGIDKKVSRVFFGMDNQRTLPHTVIMCDDFFERGGNAFDTAWGYGGGIMERLLGQWIKLRGVREQVVVIAKGAHTPMCDPVSVDRQFRESLDRLGADYTDIYMMHRDNPDVPVGEFVDVMDEHHRAGRIKVYGGSNWSLARVEEANAYAKKNGRRGLGVVSNNFSLARMVDAPWRGCIAASDPDSRAWLTKHQLALLSWSSQARGFFLPGRAAPDKREDEELVRCWYAEDNFQRLERANELAKKKGVTPINIALAYVLNQPFPTFALIGPRALKETRTSLPGVSVKLTEAEVKWLNLET